MIRPDKKSVLIYITCLYEALHSTDQPTNQSLEDSISTNQNGLSHDKADSNSESPVLKDYDSIEPNQSRTIRQFDLQTVDGDNPHTLSTQPTIPTSTVELSPPSPLSQSASHPETANSPEKVPQMADQVCINLSCILWSVKLCGFGNSMTKVSHGCI